MQYSVTKVLASLQQSCLFRSSACVKKTQEMLTNPKAFASYMQKYAFPTLALFLIQEFATCTIQIALTRWLDITLALRTLYTPFIFHPLHLTKTLVWQKQITWHCCIHRLIFTVLIRICDIGRDKQNQLVRLRARDHLCLWDIRDVAACACGQEICRAAD